MAIVRWDQLGDLAQLQDRINRAFSDTYGRGSGPSRNDEGLMTTGTWAPPVDIYQNAAQELVLTAELPDMSPDDIEITINNDTLTIRPSTIPAHETRSLSASPRDTAGVQRGVSSSKSDNHVYNGLLHRRGLYRGMPFSWAPDRSAAETLRRHWREQTCERSGSTSRSRDPSQNIAF